MHATPHHMGTYVRTESIGSKSRAPGTTLGAPKRWDCMGWNIQSLDWVLKPAIVFLPGLCSPSVPVGT